MLGWNILVGEQHWGCPVLQSRRINNCPNLSSLPKFDSLKRLEIINCSFSMLELNMLHLQLLRSLHVEECIELTSLYKELMATGTQNMEGLADGLRLRSISEGDGLLFFKRSSGIRIAKKCRE